MSYQYKDFDQNTGKILYDEDAVRQSMRNLFRIDSGEELFTEYGGCLESSLFDLIDDESALNVLNAISTRISIYEPRVVLLMSKTDVIADPLNRRFKVAVSYKIKGFGDTVYTQEWSETKRD